MASISHLPVPKSRRKHHHRHHYHGQRSSSAPRRIVGNVNQAMNINNNINNANNDSLDASAKATRTRRNHDLDSLDLPLPPLPTTTLLDDVDNMLFHRRRVRNNTDNNNIERPKATVQTDLGGHAAVDGMPQSDALLGGLPKERTAREWKEEDATCSTNGDADDVDGDPDGEAASYQSSWGSGSGPSPAALWHSGPSAVGSAPSPGQSCFHQDVGMMSYSVGIPGAAGNGAASRRMYGQQQLGAKVEMIYGLLSMLGTHDREDMSRTLLAMSSSPDSCVAMRQSGCLPLLVQLLHGRDQDPETRARAAQALHNVVNSHPDEKRGRREARVLRLLQMIRLYCDELSAAPKPAPPHEEGDRNPGPTIAALMKLSFDEEHRHAMCLLGGLHTISYLIQVDHEAHGSTTEEQYCVTLRRYAGMALTNLTFGDGTNKALLCSFRQLLRALVAQLASPVEDLRQVTASVLRNLSWRADSQSKQTLREVGAVAALMRAAMDAKKESTLKSVLSALWNLSAHCSLNKMDICAVDGALAFLVQMLTYEAPSKTLAIIENAGGILRNISSHVAVREDYRAILRENNCLQILLQQLKSPSLTVVSNACGTLWNLSARSQEDQRALWALGAPGMLRNLIHSKHKMISMGSSAALKNLLSAKPENDDSCFRHVDSTARSLGLTALPGLHARKQKALEQELDQTLAETCDNIEPSVSPTSSTVGLRDDKFVLSLTERDYRQHRPHTKPPHKNRIGVVSRSESRESVTSTHSDSVYERLARMSSSVFDASPMSEPRGFQVPMNLRDETKLHVSLSDSDKFGAPLTREKNSMSDRRFLRRYNNSMARAGEMSLSDEMTNDLNQNSSMLDQIVEVENGMASMNIEPVLTRSDGQRVPPIQAWEDEACSIRTNREVLSSKEDYHTSSGCSEKELDAVQIQETSSIRPPRSDIPTDVAKRNRCSESGYEDDLECPQQDKPIDFARRYPSDVDETVQKHSRLAEPFAKSATVATPDGSDYAETDLDQLVNYSLQYGEEDDCKVKKVEAAELCDGQVPISIHEDTVKTYCTEDTPYETPHNFSSATSLSDLSVEPSVSKNDDRSSQTPGALAREKPLVNGEEGSGNGATRISSRSSVTSEASKSITKRSDGTSDNREVKSAQGKTSGSSRSEQCSNETPLMYSRTSSLASLSSAEQQSIVDDRSSIISDLSRLTSGAMSPSELPDSASDAAAPASPRPANSRSSGESSRQDDSRAAIRTAGSSKCPSVFADGVTTFKEEGTPVEFSRATSLSSLSFEEEPRVAGEVSAKEPPRPASRGTPSRVSVPRSDGMEKGDSEKELPPVSEGEEDDDSHKNSRLKAHSPSRRSEQQSSTKGTPASAGNIKVSGIPIKAGKIPVPVRSTRPNVESNGVCDDSVKHYCTEDTPLNISCSGSQSDLSALSHRGESSERLADPSPREMSDDASSLSGDNENMLAECIQLGMPKMKPQREGNKPSKNNPKAVSRQGSSQHVPLVNRVLNRNVFPTENTGVIPSLKVQEDESSANPGVEEVHDLDASGTEPPSLAASLRSSDSRDGLQQLTHSSASEEVITVLSRNASLSSLSVESLGCEPSPSEQALLDQCITSGMPKGRGIAAVAPKARVSRLPRAADRAERSLSEEPIPAPSETLVAGPSKNVEGPSAVAQTAANLTEEKAAPADVKRLLPDGEPDEASPPGPVSEAWTEAGDDKKSKASEDSVDAMKQSTNSNHTWNDDSSPNDISVASVSISAPTGGSLRSDNYRELSDLVEECANSCSEATELHSLSDSKMIEIEAGRLVEAVRYQGQMADSLNSLELDGIQPPSEMDSLVSLSQSYSGNWNNPSAPAPTNGHGHSRRKTLPAGMVARRALSSSGGGLEGGEFSLSSSCTSHLDNVKAPSMLDEMGDLENSFLSVASITSEVADNSARDNNSIGEATFEIIRPAAHLIAAACAREANRQAELENVNPPSTFDEITDIATEHDSTLEPGTETLAMDTDLIDDMMDTRTLEAPELPCDSQHTTPASSAESTPKKTRNARVRPTPKQRREMAPDRYQTYTIGSEFDKTENTLMEVEDDLSLQSLEEDLPNKENVLQVQGRRRTTPKQRRQEDRSRFQTQTLGKDVPVFDKAEASNDTGTEEESATSTSKTIKSAIPMFRKVHARTLSSDSSTTITGSMSLAQATLASLTPEDLERDANIVINTLNETQVSACHEHDDLLDCETLSLLSESDSEQNSNSLNNNRQLFARNEPCPVQPMNVNETESSSDSENEEERAAVTARPRIVKPGEEEPVVEAPKGIRGRRKPLYSAPIKTAGAPRAAPNPRPASSSPPVRTSRAPGITLPTRASSANAASNQRTTSPRAAAPRRPGAPGLKAPQPKAAVAAKLPKAPATESPLRPLERQGTFTKDEPTTPGLLPPSPSKTRIPVPASVTFKKPLNKPVTPAPSTAKSGLASKLKPKPSSASPASRPVNRSTANSQNYALRKSASASASGAFSRTASVPGARSTAPTSPYLKRGSFSGTSTPSGARMKTSLSNQSLKGHDRSRLEDQRSNSNSSINSTSSVKSGTKVVKKEVTSKIASLWKRVEDSRNQQQRTKDNRVWITPKAKDNTDGAEPIDMDQVPAKMVRSATFEGLPSKANAAGDLQGHDLPEVDADSGPERRVAEICGIVNGNTTVVLRRRNRTSVAPPSDGGKELEEAKRISRLGTFIQIEEGVQPDGQKRVSKSAIVPPYNYYPPQQVDASSALKRSDSYVNSMEVDRQTGTELETASVRVTTV